MYVKMVYLYKKARLIILINANWRELALICRQAMINRA